MQLYSVFHALSNGVVFIDFTQSRKFASADMENRPIQFPTIYLLPALPPPSISLPVLTPPSVSIPFLYCISFNTIRVSLPLPFDPPYRTTHPCTLAVLLYFYQDIKKIILERTKKLPLRPCGCPLFVP